MSPWLLLEARSVAWRQATRSVVVLYPRGCVWLWLAVLGLELCLILGFVVWLEFWAILGLVFSVYVWHQIMVRVLGRIGPNVSRLFMACGFGLSFGPVGHCNDRGISALFWPVVQVFSQPERLEDLSCVEVLGRWAVVCENDL